MQVRALPGSEAREKQGPLRTGYLRNPRFAPILETTLGTPYLTSASLGQAKGPHLPVRLLLPRGTSIAWWVTETV